jgi:hypothetical protein
VGGTSTNQPNAYTVSSVDELPSDAVDGSTAIVPSDSLIGEWEWKDNQSPLDLSMLNLPTTEFMEMVEIYGYDDVLGTIFKNLAFSVTNEVFTIKFDNEKLMYEDDCFDDSFCIFEFFSDIRTCDFKYLTADDFGNFIKTNCNRLSGGYSLYTRENGEWVYKCEITQPQ